MLRRIRKWYLCRRYGVCPVHNVLRPHGGYAEGTWGICPVCSSENSAKNHYRNTSYESARDHAIDVINREWGTTQKE